MPSVEDGEGPALALPLTGQADTGVGAGVGVLLLGASEFDFAFPETGQAEGGALEAESPGFPCGLGVPSGNQPRTGHDMANKIYCFLN